MLGVLLRTYKNCIVITVAIKIIKLHHADIHVLIQKYHAIKKPAQGGHTVTVFFQTALQVIQTGCRRFSLLLGMDNLHFPASGHHDYR